MISNHPCPVKHPNGKKWPVVSRRQSAISQKPLTGARSTVPPFGKGGLGGIFVPSPIRSPGGAGFPAGAAFVASHAPAFPLHPRLRRPPLPQLSQAAGLGPGWLPAFRTQTSNQWPGNPRPPAPMLNQLMIANYKSSATPFSK